MKKLTLSDIKDAREYERERDAFRRHIIDVKKRRRVALDKLNRLGWVGPDSLISIETAEKEAVDVAGFEIEAERKVGKAKLTLLRPAARL